MGKKKEDILNYEIKILEDLTFGYKDVFMIL